MNGAWAFSVILLALALGSPLPGSGDVSPDAAPDGTAGSDIALKTRTTSEFQTAAGAQSRVRTDSVYVTSGRERRDMTWEPFRGASGLNTSSIRDCVQHRWIILAHEARTYNVQPFPDLAAQRATADRIAKAKADINAGRVKVTPIPSNASVTTIETIDTGERRRLSGLILRHLRQMETTAGGTGQSVRGTRKVTRDGWYATLPEPRSCGESARTGAEVGSFSLLRAGVDMPARLEFKGIPPILGTPVEEINTTEYGDGNVTVDKTELIELSRAPVDPSLFEIPSGYREALHTPGGGRDMMQPDTLFNRARAWWQQLWPRWTFYTARVER